MAWPLQTRLSSAEQWPPGHCPPADKQLIQVLWYVSPSSDCPREGAVIFGTDDKAAERARRGPGRLLWAGAPIGWGLPVINRYSFNCPGPQARTSWVLYSPGSELTTVWLIDSYSSSAPKLSPLSYHLLGLPIHLINMCSLLSKVDVSFNLHTSL